MKSFIFSNIQKKCRYSKTIEKINNSSLFVYASKKTFVKVLSPNSLLFNHKKSIDKTQKYMTFMKPPASLKETLMTKELDFEPGLTYFYADNLFQIRLFERLDDALTPESGFVQMIIPFDKHESMRNEYKLLHTDRIRNGKLLEILDYLSALSAYRYNKISPKSKSATFVTASVDNIDFYKAINIHSPLIINAYPTWIGTSSMEIRMDLFDNPGLQNESFLGSAYFLYVLRDGSDYSKKKVIPALNSDLIEDEEEKGKAKLRQEIGLENKNDRIKSVQTSLNLKAPNYEESQILHNIFIESKKSKNKKLKTIHDTSIETTLLMHSQNMNVNGHVFGGYIIKEALNSGYVCAYMHSNREPPMLFAIDNVTFYKPVIIGSVAKFIANVCYVHEELIQVSVEVYNYINENPTLTTVLYVTYKTKSKTEEVFPNTYECGIKYLEAKRRLEKIFDFI